MIWRHLFEEEIASVSFMNDQLRFERAIFAKMEECERGEVIKKHEYAGCAEQLSRRIDKYGLLVQFLVRDREKMLQKELEECRKGDILTCVSQKEKKFVEKHFKKDMMFLKAARQQLLQ